MSNSNINQELLSYFLEFLHNNSTRSSSTIENIERDLRSFLNYLSKQNDSAIDAKSIAAYLMLLEDQYMESSFVVKASSIRQFVNWLNLEENPFWNIKLNISYADFNYYSQEELFSQFPLGFDYEHLLIRSIYELYLTIAELINFNLADYNNAKGSIKLRGKELILSSTLRDLMKEYLKSFRAELLGDQEAFTLQDPLFVSPKIEHIKAQQFRLSEPEIYEILQKYTLRNAQIKRTRIIDLLNEGKEPSEIENLLTIKLSNFYQPFVKEKEYRLLSSYRQFHPRAER